MVGLANPESAEARHALARVQRELTDMGFTFEESDERWERRFVQLVAYKKKHGHPNVPQTRPSPALGYWYRYQRRAQREGTLSADRFRRLLDLGVVFDRESPDELWDRRLRKLEAFVREHGHANVPTRSHPDRELRSFVLQGESCTTPGS